VRRGWVDSRLISDASDFDFCSCTWRFRQNPMLMMIETIGTCLLEISWPRFIIIGSRRRTGADA
jgi:hypothetical protein